MDIKQEWLEPLMKCIETIFIVDDESKEIVWINESRTGIHCYECFFGRKEPCPFCPKLQINQLYIWDYYDKRNERWLKIKYFLFQDGERLLRAGNFDRMDDAMNLSHDTVLEISFLQKLLKENQEIKSVLEREAAYDRMTGLFNRNRFNHDIDLGIYNEENVGVLYFDLNNLKEVNDTYRHEAGDKLICCLAEAIKQTSCETENSVCYRIGGDEFVLMIKKCSEELLERTLKRFREIIKVYENQTPPCVTAVGAAFTMNTCDAETLISEADKAMYVDKQRLKSLK